MVRFAIGLALAATLTAPAVEPVRVMVVGDSITHGQTGDDPWRCHLYRAVKEVRAVDMVGVRSDLYGGGGYADPSCDPDHSAYWGKLLELATQTVRADVTATEPDVIVLLAGVNDVNWSHSTERIAADLEQFLAGARAANPWVKIVVGTVLPTNGVVDQAGITAYNQWLWANADRLDISLATTAAAVNPATDLYDGVHPNSQGAARIAAAFLPHIPGLAPAAVGF